MIWRFPFEVVPATFVARPNRFLVLARLEDGREVRAHCPDPGRLRELLMPGVRLYVTPAAAPQGRRTEYDLRFVEHPEHGTLVSLDTRLPNALVAKALCAGRLTPFGLPVEMRTEVVGPIHAEGVRSRFDFLLVDERGTRTWLEVKSVTLVEGRIARFPDAPTVRGARHLRELAALAAAGVDRAALLFVIQRPDADRLMPFRARDPEFADALRLAANSGVKVYALTCELTLTHMGLGRFIPVELV